MDVKVALFEDVNMIRLATISFSIEILLHLIRLISIKSKHKYL
jgi:hypothetical protein